MLSQCTNALVLKDHVIQQRCNDTLKEVIQAIIGALGFGFVLALQAQLLGQLLLKSQLCYYALLPLTLHSRVAMLLALLFQVMTLSAMQVLKAACNKPTRNAHKHACHQEC